MPYWLVPLRRDNRFESGEADSGIGKLMFEGTNLLFLWFGLLLLGMAANPSLMVPIIFLIVVTFPLVGILLSRILTQKEGGRRNLDPGYGKRSCPACGETFPTNQVICPHCYKELVKNCPACGEILDKERDRCPTCGEKLPIDLPPRPHPTRKSKRWKSQIRV